MPSKKKGDLNQVEIHIDFVLLQVYNSSCPSASQQKNEGQELKRKESQEVEYDCCTEDEQQVVSSCIR